MAGVEGMECISKSRPPLMHYKIRRLVQSSRTADSFGICVPAFVVQKFSTNVMKLIVTGSGFSYVQEETQIG